MNVYSFSVSSHDFSYLILAVPFKAREDLSHLCVRWNDGSTPEISDSECAGAGVWDSHGRVPKEFVFQTMMPPKSVGSCSPLPAPCRDAQLPWLVAWCLHTSSLLGLGAPSLRWKVCQKLSDSFLTSLFPTRACAAPTQHVAGVLRLFVKIRSAKG